MKRKYISNPTYSKKAALISLALVAALGLGACSGQKNADEAASANTDETASQTSDANSENTADSGSSQGEKTKVSNRADYINISELDMNDYLVLSDYRNMTVNVSPEEITDKDIENYINTSLLIGSITDRAVKTGDTANIDYVGKKDGVAFDGGTASGYNLKIGSGSFIDGFEDGLIGVMPGETVDLNLTFPENYPSTELAGKEVVFTVTVNSIMATAEYADVTAEEMKKLGLNYTSKEELWQAGKEALETQNRQHYELALDNAIHEKLADEVEFIKDVPDYFIEEEVENYKNYLSSMYEAIYNMTLEDALEMQGYTVEELDEELAAGSEDTIKSYFITEAVARAEKIELTDDEVYKTAEEQAPNYNCASGEELIDEVGFTAYRMSLMEKKVYDVLRNSVNVEPAEAESEISTAAGAASD